MTEDQHDDEEVLLQTEQKYVGSQRMVMETKGWNVFRDPRTQRDTGSMTNHKCLEVMLKISKVLVYLIVFVIVLSSSVIAKGTILLMTSQLRMNRSILYCNKLIGTEKTFVAITSDEERIVWIWCVVFAFAVPEIGTLIRSVRMCLFRSSKKPRVNHLVLVTVMETFHVIGLAMMFIGVLPELDVIQGVMLTNCVCFVPGLLGLLSRNKKRDDSKRFIFVLVDLAALAAQATAFVVWPLLDSSNSSLWLLPVALVMVSCGWWENYVSVQSSLLPMKILSRIKEEIRSTRYFTYAFVSVWKIVTFFFSSVVILYLKGNSVSHLFTMFHTAFSDHNITVVEVQSIVGGGTIPDLSDVLPDGVTTIMISNFTTPIYVVAIQILSAYFAYVFGKFACKILIQGFSYALPVNLTIPVSVSLLIAACALRNRNPCFFHGIIPDYLFYDAPLFSVLGDFISKEYAWVWLLWLLSQTWITLHIWTPKCERLASTDKLFVTPMYSGLLIDQSLGLNRNQNDQPKIIIEDSSSIQDAKSDTDEEPIYEDPSNFGKPPSTIKKSDLVTKIYACATMWHENKDEMLDFLKSILRLDQDQCARKNAQKFLKIVDPDYYEFETHIFFDDSFEISDHDYNDLQVNPFIKRFIDVVDEAVSEVHHTQMRIRSPKKSSTPYGGRLDWTLPGNTKMIVHLKDRSKIRHRKRWSQVMYMYYLLGHRIMDLPISVDRKEVIAANTYLLTLDGDIDFQPSAVKLLVDLMKKNANLGAACGRVHPVGSGPMIWCQKFEYAITHWLQKATEHVIGCVICSPGCFSLYRAKALMDDNVMKKYTTISNEARHCVQYDQGEDRWLCNLLLQRGYRIEYSAASDAYTHAPKNFKEFYYQRRRWVPSTMINLVDLIVNYKSTVKNNRNISLSYIFYQVLLAVGTILGPGTILLILIGAFVSAFGVNIWTSFYYNVIPIALFVVICFACKSNIQLFTAAVISILYGLAMMIVLVSIFIQMSETSWLGPTALFLFIVTSLLVISGFMHPQELVCLPCGVIYYLTIPSIYMLLTIYSITNLNNVSWGTRELEENKISAGLLEEEKDAEDEAGQNTKKKLLDLILQNKKDRNKNPSALSFALFNCSVNDQNERPSEEEALLNAISENLGQVMNRLDTMKWPTDPRRSTTRPMNQIETSPIANDEEDSETESVSTPNTETDRNSCLMMVPFWFHERKLKNLEIDYLSAKEERFWKDLIEEYLFPIEENESRKAGISNDLKNFRDVVSFAFLMLNALFVLSIFLLELNQETLHIEWPIGVETTISYCSNSLEVHIKNSYLRLEPIGLVFFLFFIPILMIQFTAMLFHRFGTFAHILASTEFEFCKKKFENVSGELLLLSEDAVEIVKDLQRMDDAEDDYDDENISKPARRETIRNLEMNRRKTHVVYSNLDDTFRARFFSISEGTKLIRSKSLRRSTRTFQAFEARRNTVLAEEKRSKEIEKTLGGNDSFEMAGDSISSEPDHISVNKSFESVPSGFIAFPFEGTESLTESIYETAISPFDVKSEFKMSEKISVEKNEKWNPSSVFYPTSFEMEELRAGTSDTSS